MKIRGKKISGRNIEICIIPRSDGEDIVFKCAAVLDMDDFEKLCPEPIPPTRIGPGNTRIQDVEDNLYKGLSGLRNEKRIHYLVIKSLEATEDLEWDTVSLSDSDSWANYKTELKDAGFTDIETMRIVNSVMIANCLNEGKLEEAKKAFLAGQVNQAVLPFTPNGEQQNTVSGVPVNA